MPLTWKLLSPFLIDLAGHEADYVKRLGEAIQADGDAVEVIVPQGSATQFRALDVRAELLCAQRLPVSGGLPSRIAGRIVRTWRAIRARAAYRRQYLAGSPDTVWLLHTTSFDELDIALRAFASVPSCRIGVLKVILRADHHDDPKRIRQFRDILTLAGDGVQLYADTVDLAEKMSILAPRPVAVVPIPGIEPGVPKPRNPRWIYGYFGLRRRSKGFDRLPAIAAQLCHVQGHASFQAIVHGSAEVDAREDHAASEQALLATGAVVRSERLQPKDYIAALLDTRVVILPYDPFEYRYGSSGVFVDAIKAGCSAVVPLRTWMAKEAARNGLTRVFAVDFADPGAVTQAAGAALQACADWPELSRAEADWSLRNSPQGLLAALRKMP